MYVLLPDISSEEIKLTAIIYSAGAMHGIAFYITDERHKIRYKNEPNQLSFCVSTEDEKVFIASSYHHTTSHECSFYPCQGTISIELILSLLGAWRGVAHFITTFTIYDAI
jgi:hypothetical protein